MPESHDQQLIARTLRGDSVAFDELVQKYQDRLVHSLELALGSREDALDVAQQAFVLAWRKLNTYRGESGFYSWLYRISRNVGVSSIRRERRGGLSLDQMHEAAGFEVSDHRRDATPAQPLEQSEDVAIVRAAMQKIAVEFRQPLVLKEIDGCSYEEIASILDIPLGTVRSRIFRARQELTGHLERSLKEKSRRGNDQRDAAAGSGAHDA